MVDRQKIARVAHEANRAWCVAHNDLSQPPWDEAPDWQKESAIAGVNLHLLDPSAGDSASHESWMKHKILDGWVYGDEKNPDSDPPTHPCLVPFEDLPPFQKAKDRIFRYIVHAMRDL